MKILTILVIGSGPIIIGQGCEFDYSGTQACKTLKKMGHKIILINSNPATIMTDKDTADEIYIEAINTENILHIIKKHNPQYLLPTVGGQTALNMALELHEKKILQEHNIKMLAVTPQAIKNAENRKLFAKKMEKIGLKCPQSFIAKNIKEALEIKEKIGLPAIIRPSFTLGGEGGGIAYNEDEFIRIVNKGLQASTINEVQIDQSVIGWKEIEYEVIRDKNGNKLLICTIENLDPMGVHTGDSITCAPMMTVSNKEAQIMRDAAFKIVDEIGIIAGGANVQFAINPEDGEILVVEMNPRVSRSSALASKATGFPIAKVSAKLAMGETLDKLKNEYMSGSSIALEPTLDYVVIKAPKFNFEKFSGSPDLLTTSMKSIGETMAIGRNFEEALQKALASLENPNNGLYSFSQNPEKIKQNLQTPNSKRIFYIADAMRVGMSIEKIIELTGWDKWFLEKIANIIYHEDFILHNEYENWEARHWLGIKQVGMTDERIAHLINKNTQEHHLPEDLREEKLINLLVTSKKVRQIREELGIKPVYKKIDSCAAEFHTNTQYHYSSFENCLDGPAKCESESSEKKKVIIIGSGPNRIGQGIEFDYACVHACQAIKKMGIQVIMVNSNPSTVSTDFDTADKLYFEPLDQENILNILEKEKDNLLGVITQFGGQTPLNLMKKGTFADYKILGTSPENMEIAENREAFGEILKKLELNSIKHVICNSIDEIYEKIDDLQFPILIRPSYVIGGSAMEVIQNMCDLENYIEKNKNILSKSESILVDEFLLDAKEFDAEIIGDGESFTTIALMEHIEKAGIHSGDSTSIIPTFSIDYPTQNELRKQSEEIAKALNIKGLCNIQFAIKNKKIYVIEANPRSSRSIPFVAKALGQNFIDMAVEVILGKTLKDLDFLETPKPQFHAVKKSIFPFARFPNTNPVLGPEMKSTGEVMGIDQNLHAAIAKAYTNGGDLLPSSGNVLFSVQNSDKEDILLLAQEFLDLGFNIYATSGTANFLTKNNIKVKRVKKMSEGRPNINDLILNNEIDLIINTPSGHQSSLNDGMKIRISAISQKIHYTTTLTVACSMLQAIKYLKNNKLVPHQM